MGRFGVLVYFRFCSSKDFGLVLVCGADHQLEADGDQNHQTGKEPVAGSVRATREITVNVTQGRTQAKAQGVGGIEDAKHLGVGGRAEQIVGH